MQIKNQIALISGGGSGMGATTAKALAESGAKVILLDKNIESASQVADEIDAVAFECDVSQAASVEQAIAKAIRQVGVPRIGVLCAGIAPAKKIVGREGPMALDAFQQVIDINLNGTFNVLRVLAHHMSSLEPLADDERGVIINTASIAAYEGQVGQAAYSASKGGVIGLTLPAARELARFGVRVVTIAPGLVATPMLLNMPQAVQDSLSASVPFPKRLAQPEEFAKLALHVVDNTMLNGCVLRLDGALRMQP